MRANVAARKAVPTDWTHEGGKAAKQKPEVELERAVLSCLLFENTFYEKSSDIAERIRQLVLKTPAATVYALAEKARNQYQLRHVPLWLLVCQAAKEGQKNGLAGAVASVVQRPDEITELLALYWRGGKKPIAAQLKKGIARAFGRFSRHQISKWNRDSVVKLRDAMFLTHPKPDKEWQPEVWKSLAEGTLEAPDTWEVALSAGADKKATWERLLAEKKLGIMALLMNLRNMQSAGVENGAIRAALRDTPKSRAFPYRFLTAARYAPGFAAELSDAMVERCRELPKLRGLTHVVIDVSGSMDSALSSKSESTRLDAAASVAVCAREACDDVAIFTFSHRLVEIPNHRGLPLAAAAINSQQHGGTYLAASLNMLSRDRGKPDRIIVITDEQSHDGLPFCHAIRSGYIVNVAPYKPGLETKSLGWTRINGWSDRLMDYIAAIEGEGADTNSK